MDLKVIGTGSQGNAYILGNDKESLLIECGVKIKDIKISLDFDLSKVVGCLLTHEHGDHAKSVREVMNLGIKVYSNKGTFEALGIPSDFDNCHHRIGPLHGIDDFKIGNFTIMSFDVRHDAKEPCGFLIHHPDCGKVLFITDTFYCPYTFKGLNNIIIEANFSKKILGEKLYAMEFLKNRILKSHMSLETCIDFIKSNDTTAINNIVLIHLSDTNSHEVLFKKEVETAVPGKTVTVASNGLVIPLNKTPF